MGFSFFPIFHMVMCMILGVEEKCMCLPSYLPLWGMHVFARDFHIIGSSSIIVYDYEQS